MRDDRALLPLGVMVVGLGLAGLAGLAGCVELDDGLDDGLEGLDEPLAELESAATLESFAQVCEADDWVDLVTVDVPVTAGQTVYLYGKATAVRTTSGNQHGNSLEIVRILCDGRYVQSTRNHRGNDSPDEPGMTQYASLLYHPPAGVDVVTCTLQANAGKEGNCFVFLPGESYTWLHPYVQRGGWAWGTNLDTHNAIDNNDHPVTVIGPGRMPPSASYPTGEKDDLGSSEYVLKGRRISVDPTARSLDAVTDVSLTCEGDPTCSVTTKLLVQRMKSPTSSTVCHTTTASKTVTLNDQSHHHKVLVKADDAPMSVTCTDGTRPSGRSFIIKTQVTLNSPAANERVIVEYGRHDDPSLVYRSGYSVTSVYPNF